MAQTRTMLALVVAALSMVVPASVTLAGPAPSGPPAMSGGPRVIVAATCNAIGDAARRACNAVRDAASRGVMAMVAAKMHGATNDQIVALGRGAADEVNRRAAAGVERIGQLRARGLEALSEAGGTDEQAGVINECARRGSAAVGACRDEALATIRNAVYRLTH